MNAQDLTDAQLRERYASIPWDEPIGVTVEDVTRLGCRLCIARFGVKGSDIEGLYKTRAEWEEHMRQFH